MIEVTWETKRTPKEVTERVNRVGGLNVFGEPNFRIVWGASRLAHFAGEVTKFDAHGNEIGTQVEIGMWPKQMPFERWHLERWMAPSHYGSPEQWYRTTTEWVAGRLIARLGPYPSRGEYESVFCFEDMRTGGFLDLTPEICAYGIRMIQQSQRFSYMDRLLAKRRMIEKKEAAAVEEDYQRNLDALPAFCGSPMVSVP